MYLCLVSGVWWLYPVPASNGCVCLCLSFFCLTFKCGASSLPPSLHTSLHLIAPSSAGLFHQALMESDVSGFRYRTLDDMSLYGDKFCELLGCKAKLGACDVSCMRSANTTAVGHAWNDAGNAIIPILFGNWGHLLDAFLDFTPTMDGKIIPSNVYTAWKTGNYNKQIPLLFGTNRNEGATFVYAGLTSPVPAAGVDAALDVFFGSDDAKKVRAYYNDVWPKPLADGRAIVSEILTDYWFRCSSEMWANVAAKNGTAAYVYLYDHVFSDAAIFASFGLPKVCEQDVCHASELPLVFHSSTNPKILAENVTFTPAEKVLEQSFVDYWTSFVIHGDPNVGNDQPHWPMWDPSKRISQVLKTPSPTNDTSVDLCTFWDSIGYSH